MDIIPLCIYGGHGGNRTRVRKQDSEDLYVCSLSLVFIEVARQTGIATI